MKKINLIKLNAITLLAVFIIGSIVSAQGQGKGLGPKDWPDRSEDIQARITQLTNDLGLTEQQKIQLKAIFQEEMEKIKAIRESNLTPQQKRRDILEVRQNVVQRMKEVLTPEQREKLELIHITRQVEKLTQEIGLSIQQQSQMKDAILWRHEEMDKIKLNTGLTQEHKRQQSRAIIEQYIQRVKIILTPEQFDKFKNIKKQNSRPYNPPKMK